MISNKINKLLIKIDKVQKNCYFSTVKKIRNEIARYQRGIEIYLCLGTYNNGYALKKRPAEIMQKTLKHKL